MKRTLLHLTAVIALFLSTAFLAKAQETAAATTEAPAAAEAEEEAPFTISGAVDAYYLYGFNEKPFTTSFTPSHNSFALGMANVVFSKTGKFGFTADLAFGPRAEGANGYVDADGRISTLTLIKQLFVTYTPTDWMTLTLGNFGTFVGYEVIDAPLNMNYSTSYMFTNGPFYHTGLKANFKLSEKFGAMVGVFNDTDTKIDVVPGKHVGAQLSYNDGTLAVYLNFLNGKHAEATDATPDVFNHQIDLTATLALGKLGLGLNVTDRMFNPAEGETNSWFGSAIYANYPVTETAKIALRTEYINDSDGIITGVADNSILALTLSGNITVGPLIFIPEFRIDNTSKEGYFQDADGKDKKSNAGLLFAAIYKF
ncbi:MAG: porin [Saprospiraceae bacterium]